MSAGDWLRTVDPPVPAGFLPELVRAVSRMEPDAGQPGREESVSGLPAPTWLLDAASDALARALSPAGRAREGAFDLLAADALVTWAAEAALDAPDPEGFLQAMTSRLSRGPGQVEGAPGAGEEADPA